MSNINWSQLRGALLFLLIACAVSGGLWYLSVNFKAEMNALKQKNNDAFQISAEQKRQTEEAIKTLTEDYGKYQNLTRRGFLLQEGQDLEWFDYLDTVQRSTKLPRVREFEINPTANYTLPDINSAEGFQVLRSTVNLDFELLHTGDLFFLLSELEKERLPGIFHVNGCELQRLERASPSRADQTNLTGACELQWYRVKIANS